MEFNEVLKKRRMVRIYQKKRVEEEKIIEMVKLGILKAPSAGHLEDQEIIIVKNQEIKDKLCKAALYQEYVSEADVNLIVCSDTRRLEWRYGERGIKRYSLIDGAFTSMIILLKAVELGLGACFVGAFYDNEVSKVLNLPKGVIPVGIITIGYPAEPPEKFPRRSLKERIHYERW